MDILLIPGVELCRSVELRCDNESIPGRAPASIDASPLGFFPDLGAEERATSACRGYAPFLLDLERLRLLISPT